MKILYTCRLSVILATQVLLAQPHTADKQGLHRKVEQSLRLRRASWTKGALFAPLGLRMTAEEHRAMSFLYAYMPLSDITDYSGGYHLDNVRMALKARAEMPWGKRISERDFYHFVLPARVNNEALDSVRIALYDTLKKRVAHLSMEQAVIEVNRFCHEAVTYSPSDARTSAPLATIRSAYGRCGEESTLLVAALRTVGIPARQVYTPRWAHTDDNHAWVEAWVDGKWRFMGACEPEAVLDLGWFNAPASRAMLVHTRVFGDYAGPEPVISRNSCVTEINVTEGYAPVRTAEVEVVDAAGQPIEGAMVEFKVYNYGEFYTVGRERSNRQGLARFMAGLGDMLVWASTKERFGFSKLSFAEGKRTRVILEHRAGDDIKVKLDIIPPRENPRYPVVTEAQRAENTRLLAYEDSIRNAYVASFSDKQLEGLDARGNWQTLQTFVKTAMDKKAAMAMLRVISAKDRRDAKLSNLQDHLMNTRPDARYTSADSALVWQYIYSPRVGIEEMSPYKGEFLRLVPDSLQRTWRKDIAQLAVWCREHITVDNESNPHRFAISPIGIWRARRGDAQSVAIFFVSMARAMGYAARVDEVTGKTQYQAPGTGAWVDVQLKTSEGRERIAPKGTLKLDYKDNGVVDNPHYYTHFSISRLGADNALSLQSYDVSDRGLEQGASWAGLFRSGVEMEVGNYLLVTGSRMASGNVLAELRSFSIQQGQETSTPLVLRRDSTQVAVLGAFDAETRYGRLGSQQELAEHSQLVSAKPVEGSVLSTTGRGYYILGILGAQQEPSNHALRDLARLNETLNAWGRPMLLLFANEEHRSRYRPEEFPDLSKDAVWGVDLDGRIREALIKEFKLNKQELPIFIIADTFNRVVYIKQGYTIGLGEQLKAVIAGLRAGGTLTGGACTMP
ncbi:MAG: transglutaminase domain-containing protein [Porphyromonas sp.]|nr:transglutaminase domain-containing protein [Porphyromonas sp.]